MKKIRRYIIYTWIVLICFAAGQVMAFAHQHLIKYSRHQTSDNQQTITEKCQLCDAMHHSNMTGKNQQYFSPVVSTDHFYNTGKYDLINIIPIPSAGRSPPLS